jgi:hypothetical protein
MDEAEGAGIESLILSLKVKEISLYLSKISNCQNPDPNAFPVNLAEVKDG